MVTLLSGRHNSTSLRHRHGIKKFMSILQRKSIPEKVIKMIVNYSHNTTMRDVNCPKQFRYCVIFLLFILYYIILYCVPAMV